MITNTIRSKQTSLSNWETVKRILLVFLLLSITPAWAQTVLISPTGSGGFETGGIPTGTPAADFSANGWTVVNGGPSTNRFFVGTAGGVSAGTYHAFTGPNATTWQGEAAFGVTTVSHIYQDVFVPSGQSLINISLRHKISTSPGGTIFLRVHVVPTTTIPLAGTALTVGQLGADVVGTTTYSTYTFQGGSPGTGTNVRVVISYSADESSPVAAAIDEINVTSSVPSSFTATAQGGLWNSPATWVGGNVPPEGNDIVIPSGSRVTVNQVLKYSNISVDGNLHISQIANSPAQHTIFRDLTVGVTGNLYCTNASSSINRISIGRDFVNNGSVNAATAILIFNGLTNSQISGTGTFTGTGGRGVIQSLIASNSGTFTLNQTQNITVTNQLSNTCNNLISNNKLRVDNAVDIVQNTISQVIITAMGSGYTTAPVVAGAAAANWATGATAVGALRINSGRQYVSLDAVSSTTAPTHTTNNVVSVGGKLWLHVGSVGTIGVPFGATLSPTAGAQYFYNGALYTCVTAGTMTAAQVQSAMPISTTLNATITVGTATFRCVGTAATASVNYDASTQTVRSLNLTSGGSGYFTNPAITILNTGAGSGAAASSARFQILGPFNSIASKATASIFTGSTDSRHSDALAGAAGNGVYSASAGTFGWYNSAVTVGFTLPPLVNLVTAQGSGYTSAPTINISGGTVVTGSPLTSAAFQVNIANGRIISFYCSTPGTTTYSVPPTITLSGGGGSGATISWGTALPTATVTLSNGTSGYVTSVNITNNGYGYGTAPTMAFRAAVAGELAAGSLTCRLQQLNVQWGVFEPQTNNPNNNSIMDMIPTNRRVNVINIFSGAQTFTSNIESTAQTIGTFAGIIDMGGNNLRFSNPDFVGTAGSATAYVTNGSVELSFRGGNITSATRTFPIGGGTGSASAQFVHVTGAGTISTGFTYTSMRVSRFNSPSGTVSPAGNITGIRGVRVDLIGSGTLTNLNPNRTMQMFWNNLDNLVSNNPSVFVAEATATSGPWTIRSAAGTPGTLPSSGSRTTATAAPGPFTVNNPMYFSWVNNGFDVPNPTAYNVTGGPGCNSSITIGLDGSEIGVTYQLLLNNTNVAGSTVLGTGSAVSFGLQSSLGTYTVVGTNEQGESTTMSGNAVINPQPQGSISGNSICPGDPGQFTFTSTSGTGPFILVIGGIIYTGVVSGIPFNGPSPVSTTSYTLTSITDVNGCERTSGFTGASATITVISCGPVVSFPQAPDEPCGITTDLPVNLLGDVIMSNFSNSSATTTALSNGLTAPSCQSNYGRDVWFRAVVPPSGSIAINLQSSSDLVADAWVTSDNSCTGTFTNVGCNDNAGFGQNPWLQVTSVAPGRPVWIRVARQGSGNPGANFSIGISEGAVWSGAFNTNMLQQTDDVNGDNNWKFIDNARLADIADPVVTVIKTSLTNYPVLDGTFATRGIIFRRHVSSSFLSAQITVGATGVLNIDKLTDESGFIKSNLSASARGRILGPGITNFVAGTKTYNVEAPIDFGGVVIARANTTVNSGGNMIFLNNSSLLSGNVNRDGFDATGNVTGNIRYQRTGSNVAGIYNYWSSPVSGAPISVLNNVGLGNNIYLYDNTRTGANTNVLAGWEGPITASSSPTNASAAMIACKGYIQTAAGNGSVTFNGAPRQTNASIGVTINGGNNFNLVGNPYPSTLNLSQTGANTTTYFFGVNTNVSAAYLWRNDNQPPYGGAGYVTMTQVGTSGATTPGGYTLPQIGAAQGFMVAVNAATAVNFNGPMRLTGIPGNNPQFLDVNDFSTARIRIYNTEETQSYETMLAFKDDATDGIDHQQDAQRFPVQLGLEVFTVNGDNQFVIQALPTLHNGRIIPLGTQMANANATYKIRLTEFANFDATTRVYIEDLATGAFHNLSANNTYEFVNMAWTGVRFKLHFRAPIAVSANGACAGEATGKLIVNNPNPTPASLTVKNAEGLIIAQENNWMGDKIVNNMTAGNYTINVAYEPTDVITRNAVIEAGSLNGAANFTASAYTVSLDDATVQFTGINNGANSITWDFGDGQSVSGILNPVHTYTQAGQYTVTLTTMANGCGSSTSKVINVGASTVGIGSIANQNSFSIYPNPSSDIAYVLLNMAANEKDVMVSIIDNTGRLVSKERVNEVRNGSVVTLQVNGLANGIYEVVVENKNFRSVGKLSVTH